MFQVPARPWLLLLPLFACRSVPPPTQSARDDPGRSTVESAALARISELEALRSLEGETLEHFARAGGSTEVRLRSLRALARIQAPQTLPTVSAALIDPDPAIREEAAFALGQLALAWDPPTDEARALMARDLEAALATETQVLPRVAQLEALGKVATAEVVPPLVRELAAVDASVRARAALSLGLVARAGVTLPPTSLEALAALSAPSHSASVRYAAAYALAQAKAEAGLPALRRCVRDADPEVRAVCTKGLSAKPSADDLLILGAALEDADERVAVEAVRGLVTAAKACPDLGPCVAAQALRGLDARLHRVASGGGAADLQPVLALAQSHPPRSLRPSIAHLRQFLEPFLANDTTPERGSLARIDCRLAATLTGLDGTLAAVRACGAGLVAEPERLALGLQTLAWEAPGASGPSLARATLAADLLADPDVRVHTAALGALAAHPVTSLAPGVRPLLVDRDPLRAAGAATVLARMGDRESAAAILTLLAGAGGTPDLALPVIEAVAELELPEAIPLLRTLLEGDPEASIRSAAAAALTILEGRPVRPTLHPRDPVLTARLATRTATTRLRLRTEHGDIVVRLDREAAPLTSANLAGLAARGSFRNVTFHRVVPDFVAQSGDPRGTGEGGPGYTIPCEITRRPYDTGTLGMALSGKDTGGSQFFVTTSPQPHLDGRYTAFGKVVEGQDVVRRLLEGDRILEVIPE